MIDALLASVQGGKPWLERFTRTAYPDAYREYCDRFRSLYRTALAETDPEALAEALMEALAEGRKRERFWKRSVRTFEEKQMLVAYLAPMLVDMGQKPLADALRAAWVRRWPGEDWQVVRHSKLRSSFRNTILGIEMPGSRRDDDGEDE